MKAVVAAFNQEKDLVGAFSVIVQLHRLTSLQTTDTPGHNCAPGCGEAGVNRKYFCLISKVSSDNETLFCEAAKRELLLTDVWGNKAERLQSTIYNLPH